MLLNREEFVIFMQSRVPLSPGKFCVVVLVHKLFCLYENAKLNWHNNYHTNQTYNCFFLRHTVSALSKFKAMPTLTKVSFCSNTIETPFYVIIIDRMQKWLPINYSFIFVLIRLTSLVSMRKIQKNFHRKMRLVSLISIHTKE